MLISIPLSLFPLGALAEKDLQNAVCLYLTVTLPSWIMPISWCCSSMLCTFIWQWRYKDEFCPFLDVVHPCCVTLSHSDAIKMNSTHLLMLFIHVYRCRPLLRLSFNFPLNCASHYFIMLLDMSRIFSFPIFLSKFHMIYLFCVFISDCGVEHPACLYKYIWWASIFSCFLLVVQACVAYVMARFIIEDGSQAGEC